MTVWFTIKYHICECQVLNRKCKLTLKQYDNVRLLDLFLIFYEMTEKRVAVSQRWSLDTQ